MVRNEYRERWAQWLPSALDALAKVRPILPRLCRTCHFRKS